MNELIIFTHIPKTGGINFYKTIVEPNVTATQMLFPKGARSFIKEIDKQHTFIGGHVPYGLHVLTNREVKYITFLRDPIERVISFYYAILGHDVNIFRHQDRKYAEALSLKEFAQRREFQNLQTRYIAGLIGRKLYAAISSPIVDKSILKRAIGNLKNRYYCFGLTEKYPESITLFQKKLRWHNIAEIPAQNVTKKRPNVSDLDNDTLESLKKSNQLDLELYDFACERFNEIFSSTV